MLEALIGQLYPAVAARPLVSLEIETREVRGLTRMVEWYLRPGTANGNNVCRSPHVFLQQYAAIFFRRCTLWGMMDWPGHCFLLASCFPAPLRGTPGARGRDGPLRRRQHACLGPRGNGYAFNESYLHHRRRIRLFSCKWAGAGPGRRILDEQRPGHNQDQPVGPVCRPHRRAASGPMSAPSTGIR